MVAYGGLWRLMAALGLLLQRRRSGDRRCRGGRESLLGGVVSVFIGAPGAEETRDRGEEKEGFHGYRCEFEIRKWGFARFG